MEKRMDMAMRIMNDVRASGAKLDTMDGLYGVVSNYVQLSKEQFADAYSRVNEELNSELSDAELDMVVGGGIGDFFKDHWKEILIATGIVLLAGAAGAALAVGAASFLGGGTSAMAFIYGADVAAAAAGTVVAAASTGTLVAAGVTGGIVGMAFGAGIANNVLN